MVKEKTPKTACHPISHKTPETGMKGIPKLKIHTLSCPLPVFFQAALPFIYDAVFPHLPVIPAGTGNKHM